MRKIAAYIEKDLESGLYVGIVPGIPGAHTQGETLDELQKNLQEVLELCMEEVGTESIPEFVGIQEIEVGK
jgi:predicted RNase H-like HicB family nuclease